MQYFHTYKHKSEDSSKTLMCVCEGGNNIQILDVTWHLFHRLYYGRLFIVYKNSF